MPRTTIKLKKKPESAQTTNHNGLICGTCNKKWAPQNFFKCFDETQKSGKYIQQCKKCIIEYCIINGEMDVDKFKDVCRRMNRPFVSSLFRTMTTEQSNPVGNYFKVLSLPKYNNHTFDDSVGLNDNFSREVVAMGLSSVIVNDEIREFFGAGYTDEEYAAMQRKYLFLKNNYKEKTNMHKEALLSYVRYQVKAELAIASNHVAEAKQWAGMAKDAATAAKINPSQFSGADLQDGLTTFGQIVRAVEQCVDIIPILPKFKERPQDKVDFTIWCYINYIRNLKGLPLCEYSEVYKFYQDRVKDFHERFDFLENTFVEEDGSEE
jgi:hypothetical protein